MEEKIRQVMADVFVVDVSEIDDNASQSTLLNWDSIGHLNLVTALEEEFGIVFTDDQVIEMLNFKLVVDTVQALVEKSKS